MTEMSIPYSLPENLKICELQKQSKNEQTKNVGYLFGKFIIPDSIWRFKKYYLVIRLQDLLYPLTGLIHVILLHSDL